MMKNSLRNTVLLLGFALFSTTLLASDGWLAYDSQIKAVNTNGNNNGSKGTVHIRAKIRSKRFYI